MSLALPVISAGGEVGLHVYVSGYEPTSVTFHDTHASPFLPLSPSLPSGDRKLVTTVVNGNYKVGYELFP